MKLANKIFFSLTMLCLSLCDSQKLWAPEDDDAQQQPKKITQPEQASQPRSLLQQIFGKKETPKAAPKPGIQNFDDDEWVNVDQPNPDDRWDLPDNPDAWDEIPDKNLILNPKFASKEDQFNNFDPNQRYIFLDFKQIPKLDVLTLTEQGIKNLGDHVNLFTEQQIRGLSAQQLQALSKTQIQNLTTEQLQALTLDQIPNFKFHDLTDKQMQDLFPTQNTILDNLSYEFHDQQNNAKTLLENYTKLLSTTSTLTAKEQAQLQQEIDQLENLKKQRPSLTTREHITQQHEISMIQEETRLKALTPQQLAKLSPTQLQIGINALKAINEYDEEKSQPLSKKPGSLYFSLKNNYSDLSQALQNPLIQQDLAHLPALPRFELFLELKS